MGRSQVEVMFFFLIQIINNSDIFILSNNAIYFRKKRKCNNVINYCKKNNIINWNNRDIYIFMVNIAKNIKKKY